MPDTLLSYDNTLKAVMLKLKGFVPSQDYRSHYNLLFEEALKNQSNHWLIDLSQIKFVSVNDEKWTRTIWLQKVLEELPGQHFIATILSNQFYFKESIQKLNARQMLEDSQVIQRFFINVLEARYWLFHKELTH